MRHAGTAIRSAMRVSGTALFGGPYVLIWGTKIAIEIPAGMADLRVGNLRVSPSIVGTARQSAFWEILTVLRPDWFAPAGAICVLLLHVESLRSHRVLTSKSHGSTGSSRSTF